MIFDLPPVLPPCEPPAIIRAHDRGADARPWHRRKATFPVPTYCPAAGNTPDATVEFTDHATSTSGSPYSFTSRAIGTAASGRRIIVAVSAGNSGSLAPSTVTVGGISATKVTGSDVAASTAGVSLWIAQVDTGTTATIVVTFSSSPPRCGIGVWAAYNLLNSAAVDVETASGSSPLAISLDVLSGGIVIAADANGGSARTRTWAGVSEDYDETVSSSNTQSGGHAAFASSQSGLAVTSTLSGSAASFALTGASFR